MGGQMSSKNAGDGLHGVPIGPNLVGTHTPGAMKGEISRQSHSARVAVAGRTILPVAGKELAQEALPANPPQNPKVGESILESVDGVDELPVMLSSLREADTRIDNDALTVDSGSHGGVNLPGSLRDDISDHVVIVDEILHSGGLTSPMHKDVVDTGVGGNVEDLRFSLAARNVIDNARSGPNNGFGYRGAHGVDRNGDPVGNQGFDNRQNTTQLFVLGSALGARTSGLATDIDDVGSFDDEIAGVANGYLGIGPHASVREGVRGDVDDTHHERAGGMRMSVRGVHGNHDGSVDPPRWIRRGVLTSR